MTTPTIINLPPSPSDPPTPSDMGPGNPNSGTASLSALSTTAIKDGHQGQPFPRGRHSRCSFTTSTTTPEPERADRISRLDGLGCITTARAGQQAFSSHIPPLYAPAYFENHATLNECSTVGSASATGSIAGRMTRASDSDVYDAGEISEDHDQGNGTLSVGSDEGNENPVRFGECANSTSSGPIPRPPGLKRVSSGGLGAGPNSKGSSNVNRSTALASYLQEQQYHAGESSMTSLSPTAGSSNPEPMNQNAHTLDGMTFDSGLLDTTASFTPFATSSGRSSNGSGSQQSG
ncbi:hypothetical protein N7541_009403 [Penicillium brevicompactum]|uniref:Uncharacterized protein n=1 Tax=Penicillium brevicompactum TaxID=5074 RepID=A0A9W9UH79_PENBR|nr:hypothetical protein N7541_009403 [Penicillium brevicompactum]